jgi:hypothetical protein
LSNCSPSNNQADQKYKAISSNNKISLPQIGSLKSIKLPREVSISPSSLISNNVIPIKKDKKRIKKQGSIELNMLSAKGKKNISINDNKSPRNDNNLSGDQSLLINLSNHNIKVPSKKKDNS